MHRPARRPAEPLLGREEWFSIGLTAVVQTAVTLGGFAWALAERDVVEARNLAFTVPVFHLAQARVRDAQRVTGGRRVAATPR